jgi:hypothetical protein
MPEAIEQHTTPTGRHPWHYRHLRPIYPRKSDRLTRILWIIDVLIEGDGPYLRREAVGPKGRDRTIACPA